MGEGWVSEWGDGWVCEGWTGGGGDGRVGGQIGGRRIRGRAGDAAQSGDLDDDE